MSPGIATFRMAYTVAFDGYLREASEPNLQTAYELGRDAVTKGFSVLDLAVVHHDALLAALTGGFDEQEVQRRITAGRDFLLESLSAYEMVQRGFREARAVASLERSHAQMLRQLSNFLADASLALRSSDSLEEMLQLVAEQTRELVGAECCLTTVVIGDEPRVLKAASYPDADTRWPEILAWADLAAFHPLVRAPGGPVRMRRDQLIEHGAFRALTLEVDRARALHGWLAAPLIALDGHELGAIQLLNKSEGDFTELDELVLVHVAQMASAAVERTQLYQHGDEPHVPPERA
jgi:hypothetical protein